MRRWTLETCLETGLPKPVLACWQGGPLPEAGKILRHLTRWDPSLPEGRQGNPLLVRARLNALVLDGLHCRHEHAACDGRRMLLVVYPDGSALVLQSGDGTGGTTVLPVIFEATDAAIDRCDRRDLDQILDALLSAWDRMPSFRPGAAAGYQDYLPFYLDILTPEPAEVRHLQASIRTVLLAFAAAHPDRPVPGVSLSGRLLQADATVSEIGVSVLAAGQFHNPAGDHELARIRSQLVQLAGEGNIRGQIAQNWGGTPLRQQPQRIALGPSTGAALILNASAHEILSAVARINGLSVRTDQEGRQ